MVRFLNNISCHNLRLNANVRFEAAIVFEGESIEHCKIFLLTVSATLCTIFIYIAYLPFC